MIQRIQTVWLLLASLSIFLMFLFPYLQYFDPLGMAKVLKITGLYESVDGQVVQTEAFYLQTITTVILGLLPLYIIILFKSRKKQLNFVYLNVALVIAFTVWLFWIARTYTAALEKGLDLENIGIGFLLLPLSVVFLALAAKGIRKDDKLIRSADRLR